VQRFQTLIILTTLIALFAWVGYVILGALGAILILALGLTFNLLSAPNFGPTDPALPSGSAHSATSQPRPLRAGPQPRAAGPGTGSAASRLPIRHPQRFRSHAPRGSRGHCRQQLTPTDPRGRRNRGGSGSRNRTLAKPGQPSEPDRRTLRPVDIDGFQSFRFPSLHRHPERHRASPGDAGRGAAGHRRSPRSERIARRPHANTRETCRSGRRNADRAPSIAGLRPRQTRALQSLPGRDHPALPIHLYLAGRKGVRMVPHTSNHDRTSRSPVGPQANCPLPAPFGCSNETRSVST